MQLQLDVHRLLDSVMEEVAVEQDFEGRMEFIDHTEKVDVFVILLASFNSHFVI